MRELKQCPFCGCKAEIEEIKAPNGYLYGYAVRCIMCNSQSKLYKNEDYAKEAWNRRIEK